MFVQVLQFLNRTIFYYVTLVLLTSTFLPKVKIDVIFVVFGGKNTFIISLNYFYPRKIVMHKYIRTLQAFDVGDLKRVL